MGFAHNFVEIWNWGGGRSGGSCAKTSRCSCACDAAVAATGFTRQVVVWSLSADGLYVRDVTGEGARMPGSCGRSGPPHVRRWLTGPTGIHHDNTCVHVTVDLINDSPKRSPERQHRGLIDSPERSPERQQIQGNLAHNKQRPPRTLQKPYALTKFSKGLIKLL